MTTDVHQQRQESRPFTGRRCSLCGIRLWDGESAREKSPGVWVRADVCISCDVNGPPRRPQGAPAPKEARLPS